MPDIFLYSTATGRTLTCDIWQSFEFVASVGAMSVPLLNGTTQGPGSITWQLRGSNIFATSTSGEQHMLSNPNGLSDSSGTLGLTLLADGSTFTSIEGVMNSLTDSASAGILFWVPASLSADSGIDVFQFTDGSGDLLSLIALRRISGVYSFRCTATGLGADISIPVMGAFYWIEMKYTKLGTVSFAVYDMNNAQVGSTQTTTDGTGKQTDRIRIGPEDTYGAITPVNAYWDDFVLDYSHAVFPLGP